LKLTRTIALVSPTRKAPDCSIYPREANAAYDLPGEKALLHLAKKFLDAIELE